MLQVQQQLQDYAVDPLLKIVKKPIRVERKLVKVRKVMNNIMAQPIRIQNVDLSTRKAEFVNINGEIQTSFLEGRIATRIEKYENKTRVLVFTNVDENYLKPYKRTILH